MLALLLALLRVLLSLLLAVDLFSRRSSRHDGGGPGGSGDGGGWLTACALVRSISSGFLATSGHRSVEYLRGRNAALQTF